MNDINIETSVSEEEVFAERIDLKGVEIFGAGTWKDSKFTVEDLEELADNSNALLAKGTNRPPIKLGHTDKQILAQNDGQPSLGWLQNFRVQGNKLLADIINVPAIVKEAIKKGLYSAVSSELAHRQHFGWFVTGLALLGAELPAVKTLGDLRLFLASESLETLSNVILTFSQPTIIKEDKKMTDVHDKDKLIQELQAKLSATEADLRQKEVKEREIRFSDTKNQIINKFEQYVKDGKLLPAFVDKIDGLIDGQRKNFMDGEELIFTVDALYAFTEALKTFSAQTKEVAEKKEEIPAELDVVVDKGIKELIAKHGKMEYSEASRMYFDANPTLAQQYIEYTESMHKSYN
jgi:hypothetical protein